MEDKKNIDESFVKAPIPPDAKRVRRTTTEIYTAPLGEKSESPSILDEDSADEGVKVADCPFCTDEVLNTEDIKQTSKGLAHADCVDQNESEQRPTSPADRFLSSLKIDEGRGSQLRIYVYREPDPIGAQFRNLYSGPRKSVGPLDYDPAFDSAAAVEAYTQRLHHGGSYYFEVREAGKYATSWSRLIDDPKVAEPKTEPPTTGAAMSPPVDALDQLVNTSGKLKQIRDAMGWNRERPAADAPPPINPVTQLQDSVTMLQSIMAIARSLQPAPPAGNGESGEHVALTIVRELGLGEIVKEGVRHIGLPLLAHAVRSRMGAAQGGAPLQHPTPNTPHPNFVDAPTVQATPQESGAGLPQPGEPGNGRTGVDSGFQHPTVAGGTVQGALSGLSPETAQLAVEVVLRPVVDAMMDDVVSGAGQDDYSYNVGASVEAIITVMPFSDELEPFIRSTILPKSGVQLLMWLGEANPEWLLLQRGSDATDYAGWLNELRLDLRDALSEPQGASSTSAPQVDLLDLEIESKVRSPKSEDPSSVDVGAPTVQVGSQESASDVTRVTSEPAVKSESPASVGGSNANDKEKTKAVSGAKAQK